MFDPSKKLENGLKLNQKKGKFTHCIDSIPINTAVLDILLQAKDYLYMIIVNIVSFLEIILFDLIPFDLIQCRIDLAA